MSGSTMAKTSRVRSSPTVRQLAMCWRDGTSRFYEDNREVRFAAVEETISTRLGDTGVDVKLDPQPCSPFDPSAPISQITVPLRWLRDRAGSDHAVAPVPIDGGFEFEVGAGQFPIRPIGAQEKVAPLRVDDTVFQDQPAAR